MSEVVLRCPNCGTTQGTPGECDACREADVRYFCTNHTPGRWLDGPSCPACGAEFGRERAPVRPSPPRPSPSLSPESPPPRTPRSPPTTPRPLPPAPTWRDRGRPPVAPRSEGPLRPRPSRAAPPTAGAPPRAAAERAPARGLPIVGCLVRLVIFLVLLVVLAVAAVLAVIGGGPVRAWFVDVGQSTGVVGGVPAQTARGIEAYRAGDRARAEQELTEAARTYPRSALALLYLARLRADAGDLAQRGADLQEAVRREPASAIAHRELAGYYADLAAALARQQAPAVDHAADGLTPAARDALDQARDEYARALALDPGDRRARTAYACVLRDAGDTATAADVLAPTGERLETACPPTVEPRAPAGPP